MMRVAETVEWVGESRDTVHSGQVAADLCRQWGLPAGPDMSLVDLRVSYSKPRLRGERVAVSVIAVGAQVDDRIRMPDRVLVQLDGDGGVGEEFLLNTIMAAATVGNLVNRSVHMAATDDSTAAYHGLLDVLQQSGQVYEMRQHVRLLREGIAAGATPEVVQQAQDRITELQALIAVTASRGMAHLEELAPSVDAFRDQVVAMETGIADRSADAAQKMADERVIRLLRQGHGVERDTVQGMVR